MNVPSRPAPSNAGAPLDSALIELSLSESQKHGSKARSANRYDGASTILVHCLQRAADKKGKSLIRATTYTAHEEDPDAHAASDQSNKVAHKIVSWKTKEYAYRKAAGSVETYFKDGGNELPTLARGLFTEQLDGEHADEGEGGGSEGNARHRIVVRGYDKFFNKGEMAWTKPTSLKQYSSPPYLLTFKENGCIIFVSALTPSSLLVTSKHSLGPLPASVLEDGDDADVGDRPEESGLSGPSSANARVDTQQADGEGKDASVSHAEMGSSWLSVHLSRVGRTRADLAHELWQRNETAVLELCDDSFEEHVLAYERERSGLYLHGLNSNAVEFATRDMREVENFAKEWGLLSVRWLEVGSYAEVERITDEVGQSGMWHGEPIEGFVVRTHIPTDAPSIQDVLRGSANGSHAAKQVARPPYAPGQAWFFKIKFDEPYLMYRDWRELTRRMLAERNIWLKDQSSVMNVNEIQQAGNSMRGSDQEGEAKSAQQIVGGDTGEKAGLASESPSTSGAASAMQVMSKKQLKKQANQLNRETRKQHALAHKAAASANKVLLPPKPAPRSKRAETLAFVDWCYERIFGSEDGAVSPELGMFEGFCRGKGIIGVRNYFLKFCESEQGKKLLSRYGKINQTVEEATRREKESRPFTKTLIVPIAVPGCGKTVLAIALRELLAACVPAIIIGHTQSDDVKAKKTGPIFLQNIERELKANDFVIADRNNHLFQHRDEIAEVVERIERDGFRPEGKQQQHTPQGTKEEIRADAISNDTSPRIRVVALAWALDAMSHNQIFTICNSRIVARGQNHQSLRADESLQSGNVRGAQKSHEKILWRFLSTMQPFGSAAHGEGSEGRGDERFDDSITLHVDGSLEENLRVLVHELRRICGGVLPGPEPSPSQLGAALAKAQQYKIGIRKEQRDRGIAKTPSQPPRYYAIAVDIDVDATVRDALQRSHCDVAAKASALAFLQRLRESSRIVVHPHITLVHSQSVKAEETGVLGADAKGALARWKCYEALCQPDQPPVYFAFHLDKLVWDGRVMVIGVRDVHSEQVPNFNDLQSGEGGMQQGTWRPHVTVGTGSVEIRPFEAGQAIAKAEAGAKEISLMDLSYLNLQIQGQLAGMYA
ncbi:hypothetical protein K437DRAFT_272911 [Tilletiaria anomala UBC 951]|uniref:tRNA ligase n=1 Tax=Tilletiaria anomala (strain ATCC 24038 / CBS 436.72 / UBC 951) TaxID=1037660 RepID=A0A066WK67_TILAU|nr:uncharacterized protein K437DRAFT_272911 [Tilletiaria anomala UBC 951]KDN51409.1 hypothetical protein K437DRAFT_272911 [Tilletiaria anomala UBC 951]